jgi:colicin import membrane protein
MSSKEKGVLGSIFIHAIIIAILFLFGFRTPLPLPAEQGILINFGTSNDGFGASEPRPATPVEQQVTQTSKPADEEPPLTQDFEEAPSVAAPKPVKKPDPTPVKKPDPKPTEVTKPQDEQPKPVEEKPREANPNALFPGKKPGGSNTGEGETGNPGNQGNPDGSTESNSYVGGPTGGGDGISFSLGGRSRLLLPPPEYPKQKSGKVVVEVTVDRNGNVTKATGGVKGSTTTDIDLVKAAERAALLAKFNVKSDAAAEQIGTITYVFRLQQ